MAEDSKPSSGTSTPRFTSQVASAEDLLKSQTVGLVNLADFRKRRADALEQKDREAHDGRSGANTPGLEDGNGTLTPKSDGPPKKKKKLAKKILSFDDDDCDESNSKVSVPALQKSGGAVDKLIEKPHVSRKFTPNPNSALPPPKAMTKATLAAEATERERLRKEFLEIQEKVKTTDMAIPFTFFDGSSIPGGVVKVKKGDRIWLILERSRKIGADTGVGGTGANPGMANHRSKDDNRRQWARIGVDDLMLLRGEVIIPHHYEIYYFIANQTPDPFRPGKVLFDYSRTAPKDEDGNEALPLLRVPGKEKLEGYDQDPSYCRVVDRRWYEKNKHIYPASTWKEYKMGKEFEGVAGGRKDVEVVTICSHIFCVPCSEKTGFSSSPLHRRECPVCRRPLIKSDDVVQTHLHPSEDYKTSVLSGLDPTTIMECAGRALAFWAYQTTQEIVYQEHICKNLTEKYSTLSNAMDKIINEANAEIQNLQNKLSSVLVDYRSLQQRFDDLATAYKDKNKKHAQAQGLYDALKRKVMMKEVEIVASDNVNQSLQSVNSQQRPTTYQGQPTRYGNSPHKSASDNGRFEELASLQNHGEVSTRIPLGNLQGMPPPPRPSRSRGIPDNLTPQHRTALPGATRATANRSHIPTSTGVDNRHSLNLPHTAQSSSFRHQVPTNGPINRNGSSTPRGYGGILGGMKVGTRRAGTAGDIISNNRYTQCEANFTEPRVPQFHRPGNSFDKVGRPY